MALAASAAAIGLIFPVLFTPSVSRMTTFDFAGVMRRRLTQAAIADADGGAVVDRGDGAGSSRFCCSQS